MESPATPEVARAVEHLRTIFRAAKFQAGKTHEQIALEAHITKSPVDRLSSGRWMKAGVGLREDTLRAIFVQALRVDERTWEEAQRSYGVAARWRRLSKGDMPLRTDDDIARQATPFDGRQVQGSAATPAGLTLYGLALAEQPKRAYASLDRYDLQLWPDNRLEGTITRIEPEGRRGATWGCAGQLALDTVLLSFWPIRTSNEDGSQSDSAGQVAVQRENNARRPWEGYFTKLERRPGLSPALHRYRYWLARPSDPRLVDAVSSVAVIDFDNTLARGWILGPWLKYLADHEIGTTAAGFERLTSLFVDYSSRDGFGHDSLAIEAGQIYSDSLRGVAIKDVLPLALPFVSDYIAPRRGHLFKHSRDLIEGLRGRGLRPVLVSGAPGEVTQVLVNELNIESCFPLLLEVQDGLFTGAVARNRGVSIQKSEVCQFLIEDQECELVVAIGDSEGDAPMWREARVSIRIGGDGGATDVDLSGLDLNLPLDDSFWAKIPTASWRAEMKRRDVAADET